MQADVAKVADVTMLVDKTVEAFGRIDVLVANAGIETEMSVLDVTEELWDRILDVNLKGAFFVAQRAARHMTDAGRGGRILFMSSVHEDLPFPLPHPLLREQGRHADADAEPLDGAGRRRASR